MSSPMSNKISQDTSKQIKLTRQQNRNKLSETGKEPSYCDHRRHRTAPAGHLLLVSTRRQEPRDALLVSVDSKSSGNLSKVKRDRRGQSLRKRIEGSIMLLNILLLFSYMPNWLTLARAQSSSLASIGPALAAAAAAQQQHQHHQQQLDALTAQINNKHQQAMAAAVAAATSTPATSTSASSQATQQPSSSSANNDLTTSASNLLTNQYLNSLTSSSFYHPNHNYVSPSSRSSSSASSPSSSASSSAPSTASSSLGSLGLLASGTSSNPTYASLYPSSSDSLHQLAASVSSANATPGLFANHQYPSSTSSIPSASSNLASGSSGNSNSAANSLGSNAANANQQAAAYLASLLYGNNAGLGTSLAPQTSAASLGYPFSGGLSAASNPMAALYATNPLLAQSQYQALLASYGAATNPYAGTPTAATSPYANLGASSVWSRQTASPFSSPQLGAYYQASKYGSPASPASSANYLAALQSYNSPSYATDLSDYVLPRSGGSAAAGYGIGAGNPYASLYARYGYGGSSSAGLDTSATSPYYSSATASPVSYLQSGASSVGSPYSSIYSSLYGSSSPYASLFAGSGAGGAESPYSSAYSSLYGASSSPYSSYASYGSGAYGGAGGAGGSSSMYSSPSTLSSLYSSLYGGSAGSYGGGGGAGQSGHGSAAGHSFGGHGGTPRITISPLFGSSSNSHYSYLNPYSSAGSGGGGGFKSSLLGAGKIGLGLAGLSLLG